MAEPENGSSPLAEALARVRDRWTLLVIEALLGGPQRFNDLLGQIPGIAANILRAPQAAGAGRAEAALADLLTSQLNDICADKHLRVRTMPPRAARPSQASRPVSGPRRESGVSRRTTTASTA